MPGMPHLDLEELADEGLPDGIVQVFDELHVLIVDENVSSDWW